MARRKPISQTEARRLRKRVHDLEQQIDTITSSYGREYPGTWVASINAQETTVAKLDTARRLGHALVARLDGQQVLFYAVKDGRHG